MPCWHRWACLACWAWPNGCAGRRGPGCFLADASYWVYLIHLPLVGLGHLLLVRFPGLAPVKFCAVAGAVMAFGLWTYQRLVRGRGLGRLLNGTGTRKERQQGGAPGQEHLPAAA